MSPLPSYISGPQLPFLHEKIVSEAPGVVVKELPSLAGGCKVTLFGCCWEPPGGHLSHSLVPCPKGSTQQGSQLADGGYSRPFCIQSHPPLSGSNTCSREGHKPRLDHLGPAVCLWTRCWASLHIVIPPGLVGASLHSSGGRGERGGGAGLQDQPQLTASRLFFPTLKSH